MGQPRRILLIAVAIAGLCTTAHASSGWDSTAQRACAGALRERVRSDYPQSARVEVQSTTVHRQGSNKQFTVRGSGRVETRNSSWRRLTFNCIYNVDRGAVTSLRYDIAPASGGGNGQATPSYVCKRAVARKIHDAHPASGKIRWLVSSINEQPASGRQTLVTGKGRIQTRDGTWRRFTFSCTYDDRSGRAVRANARF